MRNWCLNVHSSFWHGSSPDHLCAHAWQTHTRARARVHTYTPVFDLSIRAYLFLFFFFSFSLFLFLRGTQCAVAKRSSGILTFDARVREKAWRRNTRCLAQSRKKRRLLLDVSWQCVRLSVGDQSRNFPVPVGWQRNAGGSVLALPPCRIRHLD